MNKLITFKSIHIEINWSSLSIGQGYGKWNAVFNMLVIINNCFVYEFDNVNIIGRFIFRY